jgi:hypothetical protein
MMKKTDVLLFTLHLLTRSLFISYIGFYENYYLQPDSFWLVPFADKAMRGDFDFEMERFIASPLFPVVGGLFKLLFSSYWDTALVVFQLLLASLSGVYIYKTGELLFQSKKIALLASLIFAFFPLTFWFTHTFSQESIFQALFIFAFYFLLKSLIYSNLKQVIVSAIFFSLAYLTKSHLLVFSIFIPLIFFHWFGFTAKTFIYSSIFAIISLLFSLPYGLYHLNRHQSYVISSNGAGYQFYLGNTEAGYRTVVDVPHKSSEDYQKIKYINSTAGYFNGSQAHYDSILRLSQKEKQTIFFKEAIQWIKANPKKFVILKMYDTLFFLVAGVNWQHYSFEEWLFSFLLSLPIYVFAYWSIIKQLKVNPKLTYPILYLLITMFLFSTVWYVQNRFRTITIESFYILYSAVIFFSFIEKIPILNRIFASIYAFFHQPYAKNTH